MHTLPVNEISVLNKPLNTEMSSFVTVTKIEFWQFSLCEYVYIHNLV